jgi:hypothetical protein
MLNDWLIDLLLPLMFGLNWLRLEHLALQTSREP